MNKIKQLYFATIALAAPLGVILEILRLASDVEIDVVPAFELYVWVGLMLMLIDLWLLDVSTDRKLWWTLVNVIFGFLVLPIYWFTRFYGTLNNQSS